MGLREPLKKTMFFGFFKILFAAAFGRPFSGFRNPFHDSSGSFLNPF
jgi:hypothetical protein